MNPDDPQTQRAARDRMRGTFFDTRTGWFSRLCRRLSGDWWHLEEKNGVYGVWHPWRWHIWENYRFTREEALKEAERRNSGIDYGVCPVCGTTYDAHHKGKLGGIVCPTPAPKPSKL